MQIEDPDYNEEKKNVYPGTFFGFHNRHYQFEFKIVRLQMEYESFFK